MSPRRELGEALVKYMDELTKEIVEETGNPDDKNHLGRLVYKSMMNNPDAINQIDGATGQTETNASVVARSTLLAACLTKYGLEVGDVIVLMAPNHVDVCIPYYAALYLGVAIMAVDNTLGLKELQATFNIGKPKMIFCQSNKASDIQLALNEIDLNAEIVTFDKGCYLCSFADFMDKYSEDTSAEDFRMAEFDPSETVACIITTSGTTGLPKAAAITHKNFAISGPYLWCCHNKFPGPTRIAMICSPLQWMTAILKFLLSAIYCYVRLQSSLTMTQQHCYELINKYRPTWTVLSPTMMATLLKYPDHLQCDFTCFENIFLGGSAVSMEIIDKIKTLTSAKVFDTYGMSELAGLGFMADSSTPRGSCGIPLGCLQYRLVSPDTGKEIFKPHVPGELWLRGPGIFKNYYNNPEATEETFADGNWFKTGDMFYRDEHYNYFFVERIKLMLKYKGYQISPVELENLIRSHPAVMDLAVTGIPDRECGDLPVACVVRATGKHITAQEIKDLFKGTLSDAKQLRGGVIFIDELPMTATTKVHRRKLREMVLHMERE